MVVVSWSPEVVQSGGGGHGALRWYRVVVVSWCPEMTQCVVVMVP